jgi:hypothetical protein
MIVDVVMNDFLENESRDAFTFYSSSNLLHQFSSILLQKFSSVFTSIILHFITLTLFLHDVGVGPFHLRFSPF